MPTTPPPESSDSPLSSTRTADETDVFATNPPYSDSLKLQLTELRNPEPTFHFPSTVYKNKHRPSGEERRKCQREWLDKCPYLAYSKSADGLACLACRLFPVEGTFGTGDVFISKPFRKWKHEQRLLHHEGTKYHKLGVCRLAAFINTNKDPSKRIDMMTSSSEEERVKSNREVIRRVLTALEFCGRLNLPTRGHRDDGPLLEHSDISHDGGVFRSVLKLMINCGDTVLQHHCQSGKKNAMYFSKTPRNDLLDCVRQVHYTGTNSSRSETVTIWG